MRREGTHAIFETAVSRSHKVLWKKGEHAVLVRFQLVLS